MPLTDEERKEDEKAKAAAAAEVAELRTKIADLEKVLEEAKKAPPHKGENIKPVSESTMHQMMEELRDLKKELVEARGRSGARGLFWPLTR